MNIFAFDWLLFSFPTSRTKYHNIYCSSTFLDKLGIKGGIAVTGCRHCHFTYGSLDLFLHLTIATIASQAFLIIKMSIHFTFQSALRILSSKGGGSKCTILAQQRLTGFQLFSSLVLDTFKIKCTHIKTVLAKLIIFFYADTV